MPDQANHMIRDGDYDVVYIAADGAIYKYFPTGNRVLTLKTMLPTENGLMIGYAGLNVLVAPPAIISRLIIPTRAAPSGWGGVWDGVSGVWTFKATPPVVNNFNWYNIAINPTNSNHWVIVGATKVTGSNASGGAWPKPSGGLIIDTQTGASPVWQTLDAGLTWSQIPIPVPFIAISNPDNSFFQSDRVFLAFSDNGTLGISTSYRGNAVANGVAFDGTVMWSGPTNALVVRSGQFENVQNFGNCARGTGIDGFAGGTGSAFVISGNWGTHSGIKISPDPSGSIVDVSSYLGNDRLRIHAIATRRINGVTDAIVGNPNRTRFLYGASNYGSIMQQGTMLDNNITVRDEHQNKLVYTQNGVYIDMESTGIYYAASWNASASQVFNINTHNLIAGVGGAGITVAGRKFHNIYTQGLMQSSFAVYDGTTWAETPGPSNPNAVNNYLSMHGLAYFEAPVTP